MGCSFKRQKSVTIFNARDNLPDKIKDGTYVINIDQNPDIWTHWIALWALDNNATYFDSFGVENKKKKSLFFI